MKHKLFVLFLISALSMGTTEMYASRSGASEVNQQAKSVRGIVLDSSGSSLVGVNVVVKGTSRGTITDIDGRFTLEANSGDILVFSYIGHLNKEMPVKENKDVKVILKEDTKTLDEVVVVGYGTSRKKDITGSVASVKSKELNMVTSSSVNQMLQGKVAGMSISQSSAQPGAGMSIKIRGGSAPLYVIDGMPLQNNSTADPGIESGKYGYKPGVDRDPLNNINPNDIESIEVLKDASAAAIYGASAANGVVLITTKNGKAGRINVGFNSVFTTQMAKKYPDVLRAHDFREQVNLWTKEYYLYSHRMGAYGDVPIDMSGYTLVFNDVNGYESDTDWMDEISRQGYIMDQNLSINGGTEKTKYYMSYNFYKNCTTYSIWSFRYLHLWKDFGP